MCTKQVRFHFYWHHPSWKLVHEIENKQTHQHLNSKLHLRKAVRQVRGGKGPQTVQKLIRLSSISNGVRHVKPSRLLKVTVWNKTHKSGSSQLRNGVCTYVVLYYRIYSLRGKKYLSRNREWLNQQRKVSILGQVQRGSYLFIFLNAQTRWRCLKGPFTLYVFRCTFRIILKVYLGWFCGGKGNGIVY